MKPDWRRRRSFEKSVGGFSALLSSVLNVCSSKDTGGGTLLLFDLTCAVFLMRTTLGGEAVFGLESNCKHHIKDSFFFLFFFLLLFLALKARALTATKVGR